MMKSVVITGATSFIGVHLIKEYIKSNNYNIIAVVRPNSKNINRLPKDKRLSIIEIDMNNIKNIVQKVNEAEIFYHLAWEGARVPYRDDEKLQINNYECSIKAMNAAKELGCKVFIGSGSQAEYGKCKGDIEENYQTIPTTEYGKYKLKACNELKKMADKNNMKFIWTRIFSVYGVYDYNGTLVMSALEKMVKNEDIKLTECIQNWDFINVEDAAREMFLLATSECEEGIYNIASGNSKQLKEFVIDMKNICDSHSKLLFGEIPYNSEGIVSFKPVIKKLERNINYSCKISFEEGIKKILKFITLER